MKSDSDDSINIGLEEDYDVIVVGSGYGGSVAACRMSMAGFKVCLLEKGKRYEAKDFPTNSFETMSNVRMENRNLGLNFGPKDALFQVHIENDALAAAACGLGGGSLVNAGVMVPPTVRARRDPKWPKAWEKDWGMCQTSASDMLREQTAREKFQSSRVMESIMGEEYDKNIDNPMKLSINFDIEDNFQDESKSRDSGSCLACGNCLSGCPYNAKNSTDRTYLVAAVQEGCSIKTESEVQFLVRNEDETNGETGRFKRTPRRWLVFLNDFDYVAADIVILSAGVFGTAKILFQSQLRGLSLSEKLGSGLSCNGNSVAYLVNSSAPLNSSGLKDKELFNIPFKDRPGPSISSSYTSSLGFTIQSAVSPSPYPKFIFKGITTYGSQSTYSFLHNVITDMLKNFLGFKRGEEIILNIMGHDDSSGRLTFEKDANRISFHPPQDHLLPHKIEALRKVAKKLGGILLMSRYRSTSVHLLGGCIASSEVSHGVCNHKGQVFDNKSSNSVHEGLYVCDASIIPCSVGINPILTITTVAEHVSRQIVKDATNYTRNVDQETGSIFNDETKKGSMLQVVAKEIMRGQIEGMQCTAYLKMRFEKNCEFGKTQSDNGEKPHPLLHAKVGGHIICRALEIDKMHIIHGEASLCEIDIITPYTQYMHYRLILAASSGSRYKLDGRKIMNPYLSASYAWRESTTLNMTLKKITNKDKKDHEAAQLKGKLHISALELARTLYSLEGTGRFRFLSIFLQSLYRTYVLQVPRGRHFDVIPVESAQRSYPKSMIHEIRTEDGFTISCQHWECNQRKRLYPVLLINGYATESYYLPIESNDFVRVLLKEGHDVWLLRPRLHWLNPSNGFTVEDIGRFDIPAAINKIKDFYGEPMKVHVVAHCIGGLAIHISIMAGHVSSKNIASLSCTNSSMFFKLTTSSLIKMWLPLVPLSMVILGKNKTLPIHETLPASFRHRILKMIARQIPRYERCTCDECEVFSGIFGNVFWHENVSQEMHRWMNKEYLPSLSMAAFPHLRKICNKGFIVDSKGNNVYLIHPERMALPTLYISGGRTLLVTPETSFLANKYMKMHQPGFRHERVVVDGFGHSDLLIGEKSCGLVFPYIVKNIELAEEEKDTNLEKVGKEKKLDDEYKEALTWSSDPSHEDRGGCESWILLLGMIGLFVLVVFKWFFLAR